MANTYTQLYMHIVIVVKNRASLIHKPWNVDLYKYMSGIIENKKHKLYTINGMPDHIHMLISIHPNQSISDLMRELKASSSKWINSSKHVKGRFSWQAGFAAFSCSHDHKDRVFTYIKNQDKHHTKYNFQKEYLLMLQRYNVDYNEKFLFSEVK